jgi:hypothetical protein
MNRLRDDPMVPHGLPPVELDETIHEGGTVPRGEVNPRQDALL